MSNPEKAPLNQPSGEQYGSGLLPLADEQQQFPPPPPGPPPHTESAAPPAYEQGGAELPKDEKPKIVPEGQQTEGSRSKPSQQPYFPPPPVAADQQQQQFPPPPQAAAGEQQQYFPPPPPGPPPAQQQQGSAPHPNPLDANPANPQPAQQNYNIPQYNPAQPAFAPPPTNEPTHQYQEAPIPEHGVGAGNTSTFVPPEEHHKKHGWSERFSQLGIKAAAPINSLAHKLGSQSFLPETLDKECDKAASILRSFCKNGVYADPGASPVPTSTDPKATETNDSIIDPTKQKPKSRVIVTIPPKVIAKAVGLAIFTTLRAGFNFSGATGSGILIARLPDGSWGPPSGIQVHSVGAGFLVGLDIYDCVCVINSREALAAFANTRVALGSDLAVVAGPYGAGGAVEFGTAMEGREGRKSKEGKEGKEGESSTQPPPEPAESNQNLKPEKDKKSHRRSLSASAFKPVFSYVKSRGFYAGVQVDGTVVVERKDANAAFFGERVSVDKIIKGEVPRQGPNGMWPAGARNLLETLKGAEVGSLKVKQSKDGASPTSPTFGAPGADHSAPVASGALGTEAASGSGQPPAYKDDGTHHPVGDVKYR